VTTNEDLNPDTHCIAMGTRAERVSGECSIQEPGTGAGVAESEIGVAGVETHVGLVRL
jgi:hypothetical protein